MTEERRKEMAKLAGSYAEKAKIAARNVRRDGMEALKAAEKKGKISQDEQKRFETDVQKITDKAIARHRCGDGSQGKGNPRQVSLAAASKAEWRRQAPASSTLPSSWMATAAGPRRAACRASPAIVPGWRRCAAWSRRRPISASRC